MLNFHKLIEIVVTLQTLIISTMFPVFIPLPFMNQSGNSIELPSTWQVPIIMILTIIFNRKVVCRAFTIYIILGLFIAPVFHQGGSLGYLLTPNFGYLLGIYPLIRIIDKFNHRNTIKIVDFLINGLLAIIAMHLTGIFYNFIQSIFYNQINVFFYDLGKYSTGKIGYHLIMLIPLILLIKPIKYLKNKI